MYIILPVNTAVFEPAQGLPVQPGYGWLQFPWVVMWRVQALLGCPSLLLSCCHISQIEAGIYKRTELLV